MQLPSRLLSSSHLRTSLMTSQFELTNVHIHRDIYTYHGLRLLGRFLTELDVPRKSRGIANIPAPPAVVATLTPPTGVTAPDKKKIVGILGAGPGGLYTALLLDFLGVPFKVIEARDRVGGRLYTHKFPDSTGAPYNYFDVGAMRFPKTKVMWRLWRLFEREDLGLKEKLQKYYFEDPSKNSLLSYNGFTFKRGEVPSVDPFHAASLIGDTDAASAYIAAGASNVMEDVVRPFARRLLEDLDNDKLDGSGWDYMMEYDHYSVRAYLSTAYRPTAEFAQKFGLPDKPIPTDVVNWYETLVSSTGMFDRSLTDYVLEELSFGWQNDGAPPVEWFCVDGGANQIADCMYRYLKRKHPEAFSFNKRVTAIRVESDKQGEGVFVKVNNDHEIRFTHVISTIPLPVLRAANLTKARLSPMQLNALRQLTYTPATKIGMQFHTAWWTNGTNKDGRPLNIVGGQSYTDGPLRTIVYPSFGDVEGGQTTTLIASYCWTDDADRFTALIGNDKQALTDLALRELAEIHNIDIEYLRDQLIGVYSWSWSQDIYTMGAYANFGPGKFQDLYKNMILPAGNNRLFFAGEALSLRHAWVEGALDSAWRAVADLCLQHQMKIEFKKLIQEWGMDEEYGSLPSSLSDHDESNLPGKPEAGRGSGSKQRVDVDQLMSNSLFFRYRAATST